MIKQELLSLSDDLIADIHDSLVDALTYALDGAPSLKEITTPEKTIIGTKVERYLMQRLHLNKGWKLDAVLPSGQEFDIKFSLSEHWMIPPSCVGETMLLISAKTTGYGGKFSAGLIRADKENLSPGTNRDKKRVLTVFARDKLVQWICRDHYLSEKTIRPPLKRVKNC